jgi:C-terminal processing protease CtpA/Prc
MLGFVRCYGFERIERLSGNVGYLKFSGFADQEGGGAVAAGAMAFLANTDALIIDLRDNHGGGLDMFALLASYLTGAGH